MKRIIAVCLAVFVMLTGATMVAGPASAHHPLVTGVAKCNYETGKFDVTWTVKSDADYNKDWRITAVSRNVGIPLNSDRDDQSAFVGTESVSAGTYTLNVAARWHRKGDNSRDVATATRSGSVTTQGTCDTKPDAKKHEDNKEGCDLRKYGNFKPGGIHRDGTEDYILRNGNWVLSGVVNWNNWTQTSTYTVKEYRDKCTPPCNDVCKLPTLPVNDGDVVCDGSLTGGTYNNITVPRNKSCSLHDVYVNKSVVTNGARNLLIHDSVIVGDVRATNVSGDVYVGSSKTCKYDPLVGGSVVVQNSHNVLLCDLTVCKAVVVRGNDGKITIRSSTGSRLVVRGNKKFVKDRGDNSHRNLSAIRLISNDFDAYDIGNNGKRKIVRR